MSIITLSTKRSLSETSDNNLGDDSISEPISKKQCIENTASNVEHHTDIDDLIVDEKIRFITTCVFSIVDEELKEKNHSFRFIGKKDDPKVPVLHLMIFLYTMIWKDMCLYYSVPLRLNPYLVFRGEENSAHWITGHLASVLDAEKEDEGDGGCKKLPEQLVELMVKFSTIHDFDELIILLREFNCELDSYPECESFYKCVITQVDLFNVFRTDVVYYMNKQ